MAVGMTSRSARSQASREGPWPPHATEREKREADPQDRHDIRVLVELLGEEERRIAEADDVVATVLLHRRVDRRVKSGRVCRALGTCEQLEATGGGCHLGSGGEGPGGSSAAGSRLVVQPELDVRLEGIQLHGGLERDDPEAPGAVKARMRFASQAGPVCATGSLDLGVLSLRRIVAELADTAPPRDGQLLLAEHPCQFAQCLVELDLTGRPRFQAVGDRGQDRESIAAEQPALRRGHQAEGEFGGRAPGGNSMLEGLTQELEVAARVCPIRSAN
jgi:hypothetical protein